MQIKILVFNGLQSEFAAAMEIRTRVFVEEQHVPVELERDEFDALATHVLLKYGDRAVATGRIFPDPDHPEALRLGRVAVLAEYRGTGIGRKVVAELLRLGTEKRLYRCVVIHAQKRLIDWYASFGFVGAGDEFYEAGIAHQEMCLELKHGQ